MGRWLAPLLPQPQHWVIHDRDEDLLALAVADPPAGVTVEARRSDITRLAPEDLAGADLVVASALLDMLTADELRRMLGACSGHRILIAMTVTGRVSFAPPEPLDVPLGVAFNAHQRRDGRLGPDAVTAALDALGGEVLVRPSPWHLGADHAELMTAWFGGWVDAACEKEPELASEAGPYRDRRLAQAHEAHRRPRRPAGAAVTTRRWAHLAAAATLGVLVWRVGTGPFLDGLRAVDGRALAAASGLAVLTTVCCAWRWRTVAGGLGVELPLRTAVAAYYRSLFLNVTLPGGVVGDVHRGISHGRESRDVGLGLRAVAWERSAGQAVQILLTIAVLLVLPSPVRGGRAARGDGRARRGGRRCAAIRAWPAAEAEAEPAGVERSRWARLRRAAGRDLHDAVLSRRAWAPIASRRRSSSRAMPSRS